MGSPRPHCGLSSWLVGAMLVLLAAKLVWCGSVLLVVAGFALVVAFAAALSGLCPYVVEVGVFRIANDRGRLRRPHSPLAIAWISTGR